MHVASLSTENSLPQVATQRENQEKNQRVNQLFFSDTTSAYTDFNVMNSYIF